MEECQYESVPNNSENITKIKQIDKDWKPFFKQLLISSGAWTSMFLYGMMVGAPTVLIPQVRREANDTNIITNDMASWLTSVYSFSGFPFVLIVSFITRFIGRKIAFIIAILDTIIASTVLYFSNNVTHMLISFILQGFFTASQIVVTIVVLTEYTSPKYRGIFLTIKTATLYWGIWASNAIGTFFHWKNIPLFGIACALYVLITVIMWPESPYWLASRGKFKQCAASHRWLKGSGEEAEKELEKLIKSQKEYIASLNNEQLTVKERIVNYFNTFKSKEFYKPTLLSTLTGCLAISSGKLIFAVYAIDILKKITNSESIAYKGMLIIDGITVLSMYGGCVIAKYTKRRTLLLVASSIGAVFLFILSFYLYLIKLAVIEENKYVSILLLVAFSIAVSCGPLIMSTSVYAELLPVRSRNLSVCIIALAGKLINAISLKTAPYTFSVFGLHGMFLMFGLISSTVILLLYKYLPETKDKTLQEIADSISGVKVKKGEGTSSLLNNKSLI